MLMGKLSNNNNNFSSKKIGAGGGVSQGLRGFEVSSASSPINQFQKKDHYNIQNSHKNNKHQFKNFSNKSVTNAEKRTTTASAYFRLTKGQGFNF